MAQNMRTVLIWFNNDTERLTFAVNPRDITLHRPQYTKEFITVDGEAVNTSKGRGLTGVTLRTFLPGELSRFFTGTPPASALAMLKRWQDTRRPVRLIISGTDINDSFLITSISQTITEGDDDIGIEVALKEYKFITLESAVSPVTAGGLSTRADERPGATTHTVKKNDTLWAIAVKYYGDGTKWAQIAAKNGVKDPKKLQIGKVLTL